MNLEPLDYFNGVLSTIAVVTGVIVGLIIASRYIKYKKKEFLYIGIAVIGVDQPWWPTAISFISIVLTGRPLQPTEYFFIGNFFIPIFIVLWMLGMVETLNLEKKIILPLIYLIISILADIYLIYFLINEPNVIGELPKYFDAEYGLLIGAHLLFILVSIVITGILFAVKSLRSEHPNIKLKGRLLIIAFSSYFLSGFLDVGIIHLTVITIIIARSFLILSSILLYLGFLLPEFFKNLFIKEKGTQDL